MSSLEEKEMQVVSWFLMGIISLLLVVLAVSLIVATVKFIKEAIRIIPLIPEAFRTWRLAGEMSSKYQLEGDWSSVRFFRGTNLEKDEERRDRKNLREMLFQAGCKAGTYLVGIWRGDPYGAERNPSFDGIITVRDVNSKSDLPREYVRFNLTLNGAARLQIQTL